MTHVAPAVQTFVDVLRWRSRRMPDQRAFSFLSDGGAHEVALSYAELDARARGVAASLQAHGSIGDRALLVYPPGLDFVAAVFGCLYAGWIAVPTAVPTTRQGYARLAGIVRDARPTVAITTNALLGRLQSAPLSDDALAWVANDELPGEMSDAWQERAAKPDELAILQYTSGSTATPRGVMLSHANLLHNTQQIERRFEIDAASQGVIWLPPFHDMGLVGGILQGLQGGFPIVLMAPLAFLRRPARWLEAITRYRATISGGPNFAYDLCVERIAPYERDGLDLSTWEVAFNGAEAVRAATLERFADAFAVCGFRRSAFYPCYGLAEATLMVSGGARSEPPRVVDSPSGIPTVSCGRVIDDQDLRIVDPETCRELESDQVGEIWVRGPSVAHGYWSQPELTQDVFGAHIAETLQGPYLRTGDLGYMRAGEVYVTGRLKSLLIVGGRNVHAEDVEQTVATSHGAGWPGGVAAVSVDDAGREQLVVLQEVVTRAASDLETIVRAVRLSVAEQHQVPLSRVVLLRPGQIPRTSSGKVRREVCREEVLSGSLEFVCEWRIGDAR